MLKLPTENTLDREEKIMVEWIDILLSDILMDKGYIRGPFGSALKRGDMKEDGIPVYEQQHAIYNSRDFRYYIDEQKFNEMERFQVKKDDLIISCSGTVGKVSIIKDDDPKGIISQALLLLRADTNKVLPLYLKYFFSSREGYNAIVSRSSGSVQVNIAKRSVIEQIPLKLPQIKTQRKIVGVLSSIDEKIEENERINNNLEQQAQAIFKSWFVDFEPFNGEMPHNWIVSRLGDIASIKTNSFSPVKNPDAQLEHYSIPAYDEQNYPVFESAADVKSNKYILSKNSVMISKLNPDTKRVWRPMCLSELAVSSTEFIIFESFNPAYRDFVFSIIDSAAFSDWMCAHTTGSTNSRQRTAPSATLEFQVALPDEKAIIDFCAIVTPMYDTIASNICENQKLAQLRDSILPKLMSGELDVSDIDL